MEIGRKGIGIGTSVAGKRPEVESAKASLQEHDVEEFFTTDKLDRLDTTIPKTVKRDLNELLSCVDASIVGSRNTANRLLVEALVDLFQKYQQDKGAFPLTDDLHFKGRY